MRATLLWWLGDEFEDGLPHGWLWAQCAVPPGAHGSQIGLGGRHSAAPATHESQKELIWESRASKYLQK